jgi:hypothetical protein
MAQDPNSHLRYHLLLSVSGIGSTSAAQILEQPALLSADPDVRQWVTYAAFTPASTPPAAPCTRKPASAKPVTATSVALSTCLPSKLSA